MYLKCVSTLLMMWVGFAACAQQDWEQSETTEQQRPSVELEGPNSTPAALYVQAVLEQVYDNIGYDVRYRTVPLARSFIEANKGELDGLRARVAAVADRYPNLIKIPFEILDFSLVLLADRRVCGLCDLSQIQQVAITRGVVALEETLSSTLADKDVVEVTTAQQTLELLLAGKVQAAITPDTNVPRTFFQSNPHILRRTLAVLPDYHYLHKKHAQLVPKLTAELEAMERAGRIAQFREKYQLQPARRDIESVELKRVAIVSESWKNYTDSQEATYWRILRSVYGQHVQQLEFYTQSWHKARAGLINNKADILVGAYAHELPDGFIKSDMHIDYDFPVSAFGKNREKTSALLKGHQSFSVCFKPGYSFQIWLPESAQIQHASIEQCQLKLKNDQVDLVLDYQQFWPETLQQDFPGVKLADGRPLFLFFQDSPKGLKLKALFDKEYPKLVNSGALQSWFPKLEYFNNANLILPQDGE